MSPALMMFFRVLFVASLALFVWQWIKAGGYRTRGEALPRYVSGTIISGLSTLFLLGFYLLGAEGPLALASLVAALVLLVVSVGLDVQAKRRASHGSVPSPDGRSRS